MKILSIHDGHNASAALLIDGNIASCISEEGINREKFYWGFPEKSIEYVLKENSLEKKDIDVVTVSHIGSYDYVKRKISNKHFLTINPKLFIGHLSNVFTSIRRELYIRFKLGSRKTSFFFCDHHLAHAASAYYYAGFDKALVVTSDGLGDGISHTAFDIDANQWKQYAAGDGSESLGDFYAAITTGLGFKPNRHEGKIVGLAAKSSHEKISRAIGDCYVQISEDKMHFSRLGYHDIIKKVTELKKQGFSQEDISSHAQYVLEKLIVAHIKKLCEITGRKNVALAGGVFANVKLNQGIVEACAPNELFVQPAMGDEGLVLGAAAYYLNKKVGKKYNFSMNNVYLGSKFSDKHIEASLEKEKIQFSILNEDYEKIAGLINSNKIIGWFDGRMEFGPRALGNRSIIANPQNLEINDILNKRLKRSEFMPFAPSVLAEFAKEIFEIAPSTLRAAEYMTITYNVKDSWKKKIPSVVHVDGTARPQLVSEKNNSNYYKVIKAFYELTGVPLVMNTSFNIHEEPIVNTPEDAIKSLKSGAVDNIIFNNKFLLSL